MSQQLIASISLDGLVAQRDAILSAYDQVVEANENLRKLVRDGNVRFPMEDTQKTKISVFAMPDIQIENFNRFHRNVIVGEPETRVRITKMIDAGAWQTLISASGIRSFMSSQVRSKWDQQIRDLDVPALNADNIREAMGDLHANRLSMMEQGVLEVFRMLSTGYHTNKPQMFGDKILLSYMFSYGSVNNNTANQIDDLVRVLSLQDGKPEPDHRHGMDRLISDSYPRDLKQFTVEHEYFTLKCFPKSATGHLKFKRLDLVIGLNRILAKHFPDALPSNIKEAKPSNAKAFSVEDIGLTPISQLVSHALQAAKVIPFENAFLLKMAQMDRVTYQSVNEVLLTIGGVWLTAKKGHMFSKDPSNDLRDIIDQVGYLNPKDYGYFPTPDAVLDLMMEKAELSPDMNVLEPSAGKGHIALRASAVVGFDSMTLVEYLPRHAEHLRRFYPTVIENDFMKVKATGDFQRVLLNPPFAREQDIAHVRHAYDFLAPGGRLVAILAAGWVTNQTANAIAFRTFLKALQTQLIVLPKGAFEESGTSVNTVMLVINRPLALF